MRFLAVATFAWPDHYGGAERVIGEVTARLVRRGHAVSLLTSRVDGLPVRETRDGVDVHRYDVDRSSPLRFYRSVFAGVRGALRDGRLPPHDVLHLHQMLSGVAAVAPGLGARRDGSHAPRGARGPQPAAVIGSFYAPYAEEYLARFRGGHAAGDVPWKVRAVSAVLRHGDRRLLRASRQLVVLSRYSLAQVAELLPAAVARTTVAPPGVDLVRFSPARDDDAARAAAAAFALPADGTPLLLSVRRLVPRMGLDDFVDAAALLASRGVRFHAVIAGTGEQREALAARATSAGIASRCTFLGRVDDGLLPELYRAAAIFVLPTRGLEGYGMATAEALASGLPVVATDVGANAEVLAGVEGSALVPAGDPPALAEALQRLLADEPRRRRAGRAARVHAETQLTWDGHIAAVERAAKLALGEVRGETSDKSRGGA
jgi:glycosyltransferase involved in cell wall biosynthesis